MLQRSFFLLHEQLDLDQLFRLPEQAFIEQILATAGESPAGELLGGLFGPTRRLYKRLAEFSHFQHREWYERIARQPYPWLVRASEAFAAAASKRLGRRIAPHEILFDAPPVRREVEFHVEVFFPKENVYRTLAEVSPAVHTLATRQFDDFVKRVRIFVHPALVEELGAGPSIAVLINEACDAT
jgi:hypothetical protein